MLSLQEISISKLKKTKLFVLLALMFMFMLIPRIPSDDSIRRMSVLVLLMRQLMLVLTKVYPVKNNFKEPAFCYKTLAF